MDNKVLCTILKSLKNVYKIDHTVRPSTSLVVLVGSRVSSVSVVTVAYTDVSQVSPPMLQFTWYM